MLQHASNCLRHTSLLNPIETVRIPATVKVKVTAVVLTLSLFIRYRKVSDIFGFEVEIIEFTEMSPPDPQR